jgi:hypothetical protein
MIKLLFCAIFGHKPMRLIVLEKRPPGIADLLGGPLIDFLLCERCHAVYWISSHTNRERILKEKQKMERQADKNYEKRNKETK